jgi:alpha-mannosidase
MVMSYQERRLERLLRRLEELRAWRNARESVISEWEFVASDGISRTLKLGDFWPVKETPVHMRATEVIPEDWTGETVELELWLGGEAFVSLSTGLQAGLNLAHHRFPVTGRATGGESIMIEAEVVPKGIFGSDIPEPRIERAQFVVPQREARALERDLAMIYEACRVLGDHEAGPRLLDVAEAALSELAVGWPSSSDIAVTRYVLGYDSGAGSAASSETEDITFEAIDNLRPTRPTWSLPPAPRPLEPLPPAAVQAVDRAREVFADGIERIKADYPPVGSLTLTGHAHIDLAWLWPLAETRRKIRRTFSTVLMLMDIYPDFTFNQSSAQAYAWIEEDDPALFAQIKERVAEGRWETTGGMWVEADCNVPSGESIARQLLYGQRYFEQAFGHRNSVSWLPDVFGFSGALPQLLRGAGIEGFFTTKLNWSESDPFPLDLFAWEGIDGSQVIAHTFFNPGHGYNGNIHPFDTLGTWRNFRGKTQHPESLLAFGWGDGAGGPSEKMLENYARISDFPVLPRLRMGQTSEFYASLPRDGLPRWVGELYLQLHRGTLTSQARTKALNRAAEHRLLEAEVFSALASLDGFSYPGSELEAAWKLLLLNQFHDILPGSSISEVYQDTHRQLGEAVDTALQARDSALGALGGSTGPSSSARKILLANAGLNPRPLQAVIAGASGSAGVVTADGEALPVQEIEGGLLVNAPSHHVPGLGWHVLTIGDQSESSPPEPTAQVTAEPAGGGFVLENEALRIEIGDDGAIAKLFDKEAKRDALAGRGNQLWAYVDKPYAWDAWDIDETYERDGEEIRSVTRLELLEAGPLRASVRVSRSWRSSTITQTYQLLSGSRRLDIETELNWHERQILLKAQFPLAVHTHEATYETMFGVTRRPTHRNTSWDAARFEVAGHRFADLSEPDFGVALLNDAKYGHSAHGNLLALTLLKSPLYPDPYADEGEHHFTYSLLPHPGNWTVANVVEEAFALNSPLIVAPAGDVIGQTGGLLTADGIPLGLGGLKRAEDGDGIILRLYEPRGASGRATLRFDRQIERIARVNLLEDPVNDETVELIDDRQSVQLNVRPFEVITLRIVF